MLGCSECVEWIRKLLAFKLPISEETYCSKCKTKEIDVAREQAQHVAKRTGESCPTS